MSDMIHEMRQNFIHSEAKELKDKLGLDINTPEAFTLVKTILDKYDAANEKVETTSNCDIPVVVGSALNADEQVHYKALQDCCKKILKAVDSGKVPQRGIMGLRLLMPK